MAYFFKNSTFSCLAEFLRIKDEEGGFFRSFKSDKELARALYDLNVEALKERYKNYRDYVVPFRFTGGYFLYQNETAKAYLSLCCLLHQCNVEKISQTEIYKKLEEIRNKIAREIAGEWAAEQGVNCDDSIDDDFFIS